MVGLRQGIQLYLDGTTDLSQRPRVTLSPGTEPAITRPSSVVSYCHQALVPALSWREPTDTESIMLWTKQIPTIPGTWIRVLRIPDTILAPFERMDINRITQKEDLAFFTDSLLYKQACMSVSDYLSSFLLSDQGFVVGGISANYPGLVTTTFHPIDNCFIGLHLDSWDNMPLDSRDKSTNRICINLTSEDRYFLFLNIGLREMAGMITAHSGQENREQRPGTAMGQEFMKRYPSYPVVRLRIAAKEAYIAPTENIVHDGCTLDRASIDLCLTMRGHFGAVQR